MISEYNDSRIFYYEFVIKIFRRKKNPVTNDKHKTENGVSPIGCAMNDKIPI